MSFFYLIFNLGMLKSHKSTKHDKNREKNEEKKKLKEFALQLALLGKVPAMI